MLCTAGCRPSAEGSRGAGAVRWQPGGGASCLWHRGAALRDPALQRTRRAPRHLGSRQTCRERGYGWAGGRSIREPQKIGIPRSTLTCWAALYFAGLPLISMAQSPDKFVHLLFCSPPLPFTTLQLRARAVWQPPPSFLCIGADAQVLLLQPSLALWVSFPLQTPSPQTTPPLAEGKALSLLTLPAPLVLQLPRWCLFSLQKFWLDKKGIILL